MVEEDYGVILSLGDGEVLVAEIPEQRRQLIGLGLAESGLACQRFCGGRYTAINTRRYRPATEQSVDLM